MMGLSPALSEDSRFLAYVEVPDKSVIVQTLNNDKQHQLIPLFRQRHNDHVPIISLKWFGSDHLLVAFPTEIRIYSFQHDTDTANSPSETLVKNDFGDIVNVIWGSTCDHFVVVGADRTKLSLWSLKQHCLYDILHPKLDIQVEINPVSKCLTFMTFDPQNASTSIINIDGPTLHLIAEFPTDELQDPSAMRWSTCGKYLAVTDSPMFYKACIYSPTGRTIAVIQLDPSPLFGFSCLAWTSSSLVFGDFDGSCLCYAAPFFNRPISTLACSGTVSHLECSIWREQHSTGAQRLFKPIVNRSDFQLDKKYHSSSSTGIDIINPNPGDTSYLAIRNRDFANTLWIWSHVEWANWSLFNVLIMAQPIVNVSWHPDLTATALITTASSLSATQSLAIWNVDWSKPFPVDCQPLGHILGAQWMRLNDENDDEKMKILVWNKTHHIIISLSIYLEDMDNSEKVRQLIDEVQIQDYKENSDIYLAEDTFAQNQPVQS